MPKYAKLTIHLASRKGHEWRAGFSEVAEILGFPLPGSAYKYPAWWANQSGTDHVQSSAWQSAGWRTGDLDLEKQEVVFYRFEGGPLPAGQTDDPAGRPAELTIAEARAGLAAKFGVNEDRIEITIRG